MKGVQESSDQAAAKFLSISVYTILLYMYLKITQMSCSKLSLLCSVNAKKTKKDMHPNDTAVEANNCPMSI